MSAALDSATAEHLADIGESTRRRTRGPDKSPAPGVLALICEQCDKAIRGIGAGFAYVDLRNAAATMGMPNAAKAQWRLVHKRCLPKAVAPLSPYFLLWCNEIATTDALLDAMAELSRHRWFAATDWGGLVRRILADTGEYADWLDSSERAELLAAKRARRRALALSPDDPRHGTLSAYSNYGCRCERCKAAWADKRRQERANAAQGDRRSTGGTMSRAGAVDPPVKRTATGTDT